MIEIFKSKGCFEDDFWVFFSLRSRSLAGADLFLCTEPAFLCNAMGQKHGDPAIHCTGRCSPELRPSLSKSAAGGVLRESLDGVRWKSGGSLQEGGRTVQQWQHLWTKDSESQDLTYCINFTDLISLLIQDEGRSTIWKKKSTKSKEFQKTFRS